MCPPCAASPAISEGGSVVLVDGEIDDLDYENGHNGHLQCASCVSVIALPEGLTIEFV